MTDKHTPGPWVAEDCGEVQPHRGRMVTIRDHRNIHIATVDGLDASVRGQELANARLIAAAPAMYGLLVELYDAKLGPDTLRILQPWFAKVGPIIEAAKGDA